MLSAREYVEILTTRRLNKVLPTDREVDDDEFVTLVNRLDDLIDYMCFNPIQGFTPEDIRGFLEMNVHLALRRGAYDFQRPPHAFFKTCFDKLLKNINRNMERSKRYLDTDLLDYCGMTSDFFHEDDDDRV